MPFEAAQREDLPGTAIGAEPFVPEPEVEPSFTDVLASAVRQENTLASAALFYEDKPVLTEQEYQDWRSGNFDYREHIPPGYEEYEADFARYGYSQRHIDWLASRIDKQKADRQVLDESGVSGFLAQTFAAATSPEQAPLYGLEGYLLMKNGVTFGRRSEVARSVARAMTRKEAAIGVGAGALSALSAEAMLHATQPVRSFEESAWAVGLTAAFAGILPVVGREVGLASDDIANIMRSVEREADEVGPIQSLSAAEAEDTLGAVEEVVRGYNQELERLARESSEITQKAVRGEISQAERDDMMAQIEERVQQVVKERRLAVEKSSQLRHPRLAKILGRMSPALRVATSRLHSIRTIGEMLFTDPMSRVRAESGGSLGPSVEDMSVQLETESVMRTDEIVTRKYKQWRDEVPDRKPTIDEFKHLVSKALRNGDDDPANKAVDEAAKEIRRNVIEPREKELAERGMIPKKITEESWGRLDSDPELQARALDILGDEFKNQNGKLNMSKLAHASQDIKNMLIAEDILDTVPTIPHGDKSYLHRLWNFDAIRANTPEFQDAIALWMIEEGRKTIHERTFGRWERRVAKMEEELQKRIRAYRKKMGTKGVDAELAKVREYEKELEQARKDWIQDLKDMHAEVRETLSDPKEIRELDHRLDVELKKVDIEQEYANGIKKPPSVLVKEAEEALRKLKTEGLKAAEDSYRTQLRILINEAPNAAADVRRRILNQQFDIGGPNTIRVTAGPLKNRVLDIPTERVEKFVSNDIEEIIRYYSRSISLSLALARRFIEPGSRHPKALGYEPNEAIRIVVDKIDEALEEYSNLAYGARSDKERLAIERERAAMDRDLKAMIEILQHRYRRPENPEGFWYQAAVTLKDFSVMTSLGKVLMASLPDIGHIIARRGLRVFRGGIKRYVKGISQVEASPRTLTKIGVAADISAANRFEKMFMLDDGIEVRGRVSRFMHNAARKYMSITGLPMWNRTLKEMVSGSYVDDLAVDALALKEGKLSAKKIRQYAAGGVSESDMRKMADEIQKHGEQIEGIWIANFDDWNDQYLADRIKAAIRREVDMAVVTPGAGDLPLVSRSPLGQIVFQFKAFAFSSTNRIMLAALDDLDHQRVAGVLIMLALGNLSYAMRKMAEGEEPDYGDPYSRFIREGIDRSGVFGIYGDFNAILSRATRGEADIYRLLGAEKAVVTRYASRNILGALLGVNAGKVEDMAKILSAVSSGDITDSDISAMRRFLILNNHFLLHRAFDKMEEALQ